jgi:superfamily II DNA or RNA helicase
MDMEAAIWAAAEGRATDAEREALAANPAEHQRRLERMVDDATARLESARRRTGVERELAVADLEADLGDLRRALRVLTGVPEPVAAVPDAPEPSGPTEPAEVRLQASWAAGRVVLWAGGPGVTPASLDDLRRRLDAAGAPAAARREKHGGVSLPGGGRADAVSVSLDDALGWLVAAGAGVLNGPQAAEGATEAPGGELGASVRWIGTVVVAGVRAVARGAVVPTLAYGRPGDDGATELAVKWQPGLIDDSLIAELASSMPGAVTALGANNGRQVALTVLRAVVDTVVTRAAGMVELPAPPPQVRNAADVAESVITRLDGTAFKAPAAAGAEVSTRLQRWARPATVTQRAHLVVQLDPPDRDGAWLLTVHAKTPDGIKPIEEAMSEKTDDRQLPGELARLHRILEVLNRPGPGRARGKVYLSQPEAWEFMTVTGAAIEPAGFEVRVPALSRRKPSPALRLFTEPTGESVVGAHQLANVRWSVTFDDVELTAAEVARLANEARPLVRSRGQWIALDRADLKEAAAALAERADQTKLTGAEILRHAVGLEGAGLGGGLTVTGSGWATDLLQAADLAAAKPVPDPEGFVGELRHYQSEALGWLDFLDAVGLGGCLALDMGLGKTPTVLAQLARTRTNGPALVIAPPAVVGNWAAEARRFTPQLKVVVHHGASRATASELDRSFRDADVVITTYGTAVRDVDALAERTWARVVLDEAQAIKNHTNETAQQLRRLKATTRLALTGTPIENGLGDLWSILDFLNPGLVGARPQFVSQLAGEGEAALRALNGLLVFRRTKSEPAVAAELPDKIDELDRCSMTAEQIGLYQAVLDKLLAQSTGAGAVDGQAPQKGAVLAAITALKQICNHPSAYQSDDRPLAGRSGKLARLEEIVESVFAADEKVLVFTHFAEWGRRLAVHLTEVTGSKVECYDGSLARGARDSMIERFQQKEGAGALVLSLKAGGTGLNLTAASHVVLYDRWWNPAVEDQARDRAWRIGQTKTVISHRLVCTGTVDERVEDVVAGKRHIADLVLPKSSSLSDLDADQLRAVLGLQPDLLVTEDEVSA